MSGRDIDLAFEVEAPFQRFGQIARTSAHHAPSPVLGITVAEFEVLKVLVGSPKPLTPLGLSRRSHQTRRHVDVEEAQRALEGLATSGLAQRLSENRFEPSRAGRLVLE